jgi:hypothetical protein
MNEVDMSVAAKALARSNPSPGSIETILASKILQRHLSHILKSYAKAANSLSLLSQGKGSVEDVRNVQSLIERMSTAASDHPAEHFYK